MTITESLEKLDQLQAQIIHGGTPFKDIADAVREVVERMEYAEKAWKSDQRLMFAALTILRENGIEVGSKELCDAARKLPEWRTCNPPEDGSVIVALGNITEEWDGEVDVKPFTDSIYWIEGLGWMNQEGMSLAQWCDGNVTITIHHWLPDPESVAEEKEAAGPEILGHTVRSYRSAPREEEDPDGNVYVITPESDLEAIKRSLEP
jgi:hypothetical protein